LIAHDGMSLRVYPGLVSRELLEEKAQYFRQYWNRNGAEFRVQFLIHEIGFVPEVGVVDFPKGGFEKPGLRGYVHGTNELLPFSLDLFPKVKELLPTIEQVRDPEPESETNETFPWNCGINPVLFRDGSDVIGGHADESQGETQIVTFIAECNHSRIIHFEPKEKQAIDNRYKQFDLCLQTGDVYVMNGELQKHYDHSVKESIT
jgi:2OG-Fe(II) oxygenase superfamily